MDTNKETPTFPSIQYERLKTAWALQNSYQDENLSELIIEWLTGRMKVSVRDRVKLLDEEWKLPNAKKGLINYDGSPRGVAVRVLSSSQTYGYEALVPIMGVFVTENTSDRSHTIPELFISDVKTLQQFVTVSQP